MSKQERSTSDADYSADHIREVIEQYVWGRHAERNRKILSRRLVDGICFEPLAEEFDMSVRQIQNIVYKYQERVLRNL